MNLEQTPWGEQSLEGNIIDVRTREEFGKGHLPGATLIDIGDPTAFLVEVLSLDPTLSYYVYCKSGGRSTIACAFMKEKGFEAYNLLGGIDGWKGEIKI